MDRYDSVAPLVVVAGVPGSCDLRNCLTAQVEVELGGRVRSPAGPAVGSALARLAAPRRVLSLQFTSSVKVPRATGQSPLSTAREGADPILPLGWVDKYLYTVPVAAVLVCDEPQSENEDLELVQRLLHVKTQLERVHCRLLVLILEAGASPFPAQSLKRRIGLASGSDVVALPPLDDRTPAQYELLVAPLLQRVFDLMRVAADEYFGLKMQRLREKRKALAPPEVVFGDVRFTLKLAFCAEFRADATSAAKLLESAYDSLSLLFSQRVVTLSSPAYINARLLLDLAAHKLVRVLPGSKAYAMFRLHLRTVHHVWTVNKVSVDSSRALQWQARQHAAFATIAARIDAAAAARAEQYATEPAQSHMPSGLLWLDAARLSAREPREEGGDDAYAGTGDQVDVREAFLAAVSALSILPRAKAWALLCYGQWLELSDPGAAQEAYKSSRRLLRDPWPRVREFLEEKLSTREPRQMFTVSGAFEHPTTSVGREVRAQVTLRPVAGPVRLHSVIIKDTLGSTCFTNKGAEPVLGQSEGETTNFSVDDRHADNESLERIDAADDKSGHGFIKCEDRVPSDTLAAPVPTPSSLSSDGLEDRLSAVSLSTSAPALIRFGEPLPLLDRPITLEYTMNPVQVGDVTLVEATVTSAALSQTYPINEGCRFWLTSNSDTARARRHFSPADDPLYLSVRSRPARVDVIDETPAVVAVGEHTAYAFKFISHEDEDVRANFEVTIDGNAIDSGVLDLCADGTPVLISHGLLAPKSAFQIKFTLKFETSSDSIPVSMEYFKDVDVITPFRANFSLKPEFLEQQWPAFFAPTLHVPAVRRSWALHTSILSLMKGITVEVSSATLVLESQTTSFDLRNAEQQLGHAMEPNSVVNAVHYFETQKKLGDADSKHFEATGNLVVTWRREGSQETNSFAFAAVRLSLPAAEPRVLVVPSAEENGIIYHVENPTPRLVQFSISMASSSFFAFQGPNLLSLRVLPYSSLALDYQLIPLGDGSVQNKRPLPELRVFDQSSKRVLAPIPGSTRIIADQGTLFI